MTEFPRFFALFDAGAAWQEPYHRNRYKLYRTMPVPIGTGESAIMARPIETAHAPTCILQECAPTEPEIALFQAGRTINHFVVSGWWCTGWELLVPDLLPGFATAIPVLDVIHRRQLFPDPYTVTADGDRPGWCADRQERQTSLRESVLQEIRTSEEIPGWLAIVGEAPGRSGAAAPTAAAAAPAPVPKFVAELLVKKAREASETCPISMNAPGECRQIAVTNCFHWFDAASLDRWMAAANRERLECPVCKTELLTRTIL